MKVKKLGLMLSLSFLIFLYLGSVSAGNVHVIDDRNYLSYFDANGQLLPNSCDNGDTLELKDMGNKSFNINKNLFIIGYNASTKLTDCYFGFGGGSDGSSLTGINLTNTKKGHLTAISADNILLENNTMSYDSGFNVVGGFVVEMGRSRNSKFINNTFKRTGGSTCLHLIGGENIDLIGNNISSGDRVHQGGNVVHLEGKKYNVICNNITGSPSNICWGIKMSADDSLIDKNDISDAQTGIMLFGERNTISNNNIHDFDATLAAGSFHMYFDAVGIQISCKNSSIVNNTITGVKEDGENIYMHDVEGVVMIVKSFAFRSDSYDVSKYCSQNKITMSSPNSWVFDERTSNNTNLHVFENNNVVGNSKVTGPPLTSSNGGF
ncbi:MAG: right-handed parallel beta-helix repeat-containing protein [Methanobrevibacter sp.]|jgi:hypothetical protein|nr:right-handed parallel beta-helix repeat-containing protein [Candidatus Methanovirga australis]